MSTRAQRGGWSAALVFLLLPALKATTIPRLTFEQLTDASDVIASGTVTRSWAAWDAEHKYIWTHYTLSVGDSAKGNSASTVEFAEPGGALGATTMSIAGTVSYGIGDRVVVFLSRMPNGYLRTSGWSQGKYTVSPDGSLHGYASSGAEVIDARTPPRGTSLTALEGIKFSELKLRVAAHMRTVSGNTGVKQ
jgi:hypothetical protein